VKIISTADSNKESTEPLQGWKPKVTVPEPTEEEKTAADDQRSSNQVERLNNKLGQMQEDDRYQIDMERLTRAEQRAEQLRSQLMDVQSKIADFEAKLEQIEFYLRPENIDNSTAGYGTTRPEAGREARKKQLEGETIASSGAVETRGD
jgi:predicted RNase H-like nuclease (RuvC/YqgF family)